MKSLFKQISADELFSRPAFGLLDVRAEVEFEDGHLPLSVNIPLLKNQERHEAGIVYQTEGQSAEIGRAHA